MDGSRAAVVKFVDGVVRFVAGQLGVDASDLGFYEWSGRTIEFTAPRFGIICASVWPRSRIRRG